MKKIAILGSKNSGEKNNANLLVQAARADADITDKYQVVFWEDLYISISKDAQTITDTVSGDNLQGFDLVIALNWYRNGKRSIYRDVAFSLALYLEHHGVQFWNQEMILQRSTSKLSAMMQLALLGFDVPATEFSLDSQVLVQELQLPAPWIVKDAQASRGRANHLLQSSDELVGCLRAVEAPNRYIIQEFVANDSDIRVVCSDSKPVMAIKRQRASQETHVNNISMGGSGEVVPLSVLTDETLQACLEICQAMGRDLAGIDVLTANDGTMRQVFLEVNAIPQLTSGGFVDQKLAAVLQAIEYADAPNNEGDES